MITDRAILVCIWLWSVALMAILVPRCKLHAFIVSFLAGQSVIWIVILLLLRLRLIMYPVREFPKATDMGFTMEYMLNPVLCGLYVIYEPQAGWRARTLYLLIWSLVGGFIQTEYAASTNLLDYIHFNWLSAGIEFAVIFSTVNVIVRWYRSRPPISSDAVRES